MECVLDSGRSEDIVISDVTYEGSRGEQNRSMRHAKKLMAAGLCVRCKKPNPKSTRRCPDCTKVAVHTNKVIREKANSLGLCVACGIPWNGGTLRCDACKSAQRDKWKGKTKSEFCCRCSKPKEGIHKACNSCREEMRKTCNGRRAKFANEGKCVQCGIPKIGVVGLYCEHCMLRTAARRWLGDSKKWPSLLELLKSQNYKCAYTGETLILGDNASVDHKVPRSRGGTNTLENVQWVIWRVNRSKTDMTHDEFLSMCKSIAAKFA